METLMQFMPFILMLLFIYAIYRFAKSKSKNSQTGIDDAWKKGRLALFILMPFMAIFEIITDDMAGKSPTVVATIINFFLTKTVFQYFDDKPLISNNPKLSILAISILIFALQLMLGQLINS